jgi:hypothetical protein
MKSIEILMTLIIFSVALIVYYSMFGSVVTSITGSVGNWSCVGATFNTTTCSNVVASTVSNLSWLPGILIILAALMPLFALVITLWVELGM